MLAADRHEHDPSGILTGLTQPTPALLKEAIRETRRLTDKPFAGES